MDKKTIEGESRSEPMEHTIVDQVDEVEHVCDWGQSLHHVYDMYVRGTVAEKNNGGNVKLAPFL